LAPAEPGPSAVLRARIAGLERKALPGRRSGIVRAGPGNRQWMPRCASRGLLGIVEQLYTTSCKTVLGFSVFFVIVWGLRGIMWYVPSPGLLGDDMSTPCKTAQERERQLRQACDVLERRVRAGESYRTEDCLAAHPELAADSDATLELLYFEYVLRE